MGESEWATFRYCVQCHKPLLEPQAVFSRRSKGTVAVCGSRCRIKGGFTAVKHGSMYWCQPCYGWHAEEFMCADSIPPRVEDLL